MSAPLARIQSVVERLWPTAGAEGWDAPGLISGDPSADIRSIHLAVDAVGVTVAEAVEAGADLLLVHHPLLLRGVTSVAETTYKGALLARLIRADCALLAAHTNADVVDTGTSAVIAERLGLTGIRPIVPVPPRSGDDAIRDDGTASVTGLGRVGRLARPTVLGRLAAELARILPATATGVRVSGEYDSVVQTVAVCGGAGDSLLDAPAVRGADVYITSDLRHHPASEARETARVAGGPALVDISHWASEWLWLDTAASQLRAALPDVTVTVSDTRTDPWDFAVTQ